MLRRWSLQSKQSSMLNRTIRSERFNPILAGPLGCAQCLTRSFTKELCAEPHLVLAHAPADRDFSCSAVVGDEVLTFDTTPYALAHAQTCLKIRARQKNSKLVSSTPEHVI